MVKFTADNKGKKNYKCNVFNIDTGGNNFVKYEWSDSSNAYFQVADNTHTKIPETQTKTPTKPKWSSTKKALVTDLNDKVTKANPDSERAKR